MLIKIRKCPYKLYGGLKGIQIYNNETSSSLVVYWYKDRPEYLYVANFAVGEEHRGKGIGSKFMFFVEVIAKKKNSLAVFLQSPVNSWVYSWYSRLGYKRLGALADSGLTWMEKRLRSKQLPKGDNQ